ncbi:MAG: polysaccharide deacetylase family protein [Candidatus Bathyarchaeia archaeon]
MKIALTIDVEQGITPDFIRRNLLTCQRLAKYYEIPLTLFVTGKTALRERQTLKLFNLTHVEIGVHTHPAEHLNTTIATKDADKLASYTKEKQRLFISKDKEAVEKTLGIKAVMFRAGRLSKNQATLEVLKELNFKIDSSELIPFFFHPKSLWEKPWRPYRKNGILEAPILTFDQHLLDWTFKLKEYCLKIIDNEALVTVGLHVTLSPSLWREAERTLFKLEKKGIKFVTLLEALKT